MRSIEQRIAERAFSSDEGKKGENAAETDLSQEKIDAQKSLEAVGNKQSLTQKTEIKAQNRLDSIADGGQEEKTDDIDEQSLEPPEYLKEIRKSSPEFREMQQADAAKGRLDGITDDSIADDGIADD